MVRGGVREEYLNDPLNPRLARGPFGSQSVAAASGYVVPSWTLPDPEARPGSIDSISVRSKALRRDQGSGSTARPASVRSAATRC